MKRIFILWVVGIFFNSGAFAQNKVISDSLVENLSCNSLNIGSILAKIRPEAFSSDHHFPIVNWNFRSGSTTLAACWGLSSAQRKLFYLQRLNDSRPSLELSKVFDMIRGTTVHAASSEDPAVKEYPLKNYSIIPISDKNRFLDSLLAGGDFHTGYRSLRRDFQSEVQRSQELHFFRLGNVGMGLGSGPQSPRKNLKTAEALSQNLRLNRLTLLNLRQTSTYQHIVVAKSFQQDAQGNMWIQVYDSNRPEADQLLYFDKTVGHFYAQAILGTTSPLGVFIVDEKERDHLEKTLLQHYQQVCK